MNRMEEVFSVMKKAVPKDGVTCENCQKILSESYCHNCSQYICAECVKAHKQLRFLSSHEIVSIDSLRSSFSKDAPEKLKITDRELKCSKHVDEPLKLYCHDCHKLVCRDCIVIDHKDHRYAFVVDAAPHCKAEIKEKAESVKKISENLQVERKSLNELKKKLSDHSASTMRELDNTIDRIVAKLMQKKKVLKKNIDRVVSEAEEKIEIQEKNAQLAVGEVESLLEFMSGNLERATDQEVLSLEKQMSDQVERVTQLYGHPADKFPVPEIPELVVTCGAQVEKVIQAEISVVETPPQCSRIGPGLDVAPTGTKSPTSPPPSDVSTEERPNVFTNLKPDALALVQRLSEGDIPGIEYHVKEGSVHIQLEGESKVEAAITKFQEAYKKVVAPGRRLRAEDVEIPLACSKETAKAEITEFEQKYLSTAFVLDEEKRVIRVISQARQFDQAKMFLEKALQQPSTASAAAPDAVPDSMAMRFSENRTLTLKKGDIAKEKADILVNAANGSLIHGSGVAGALNAASERKLQIHCNKYMEGRRGKNIPVGDVAVTLGGGRLACKHVIHAVGPDGSIYSSAQYERLVKQAISNTFQAAEKCNATSIVLPAISCGIFGISKDLVAQSIIDTILGFNYSKPHPCLSDIRIVILDGSTFSCFTQYLEQKVQPQGKGPSKIFVHSHKVDPQKASKNADENTVALEGELIARYTVH